MHPLLKELTERRRFGMKPGVTKTRQLLERLGSPQQSLAAVHIAGTNGKGSVAAICDSVLRAAGYSCGCYTSPHLNSINERFLINGAPVSDAQLIKGAERVAAAIRELEAQSDQSVTFFEAMTALAFLLFRDAGIRLVVLETGLGGRLDATNVVDPLISVITRVGMDHCEWLGDSLEEIAAEKGGIIKPGRPVVVAGNEEPVLAVLAATASRCQAPLILAEERVSVSRVSGDLNAQSVKIATDMRDLPRVTVPLAARYQLENIAAALCALDVLHGLGLPVGDDAVISGLADVRWQGRFQRVADTPVTILDGAHNPDAAAALRQALKQCGIREGISLIAGFCGEKNALEFLKRLQPAVHRGFAVKIDNPRALASGDVARLMRSAGIRDASEHPDLGSAIECAAAAAAAEDGTVLITGSLFLVAEALTHYGGADGGGRALNEGKL
jgi:dihydrofolate synthase / folylpolyglutamate synthase